MSAVVVWLTKGGIVEHVAAEGVDVAVIDFQNLALGDPAPVLSHAHKALLTEHAPTVLMDLSRHTIHYRCDNCNAGYHSVSELSPVVDFQERVAPGEPVPVGECPACGAVVHPVTEDWWPVPQSALDRHCLSGRFNLSLQAVSEVQRIGLDRVLSWFETTRKVKVGDTLSVSDYRLFAYFGFDSVLNEFYVEITS